MEDFSRKKSEPQTGKEMMSTVNNNCSTGSTALFLARQAVESGAVGCAFALGFEQMNRGVRGRESFRGFALEGTSARSLRVGARHGTRLATLETSGAESGGERPHRLAVQSRIRQRVCCDTLRTSLSV